MKTIKILLSLLLCFSMFEGPVEDVDATSPYKIGDTDTNLALGKNGVASTTQDALTNPDKAWNGNVTDRWASLAGKDGSGIDETWIYVDLGAEVEVNKMILNWESRPNKFKMQTSTDLDQWTDFGAIVDNGFMSEPGALNPNNKAINQVKEDTPVRARYVKMQGIQRRRKTDENGGATNNTGFSLYEFEVYGPGWSDETFVDAYLKILSVNQKVNKDFTLPIIDEEYGVAISWKSNSPAIRIDAAGHATIQKSKEDQTVMLTAEVTRNGVSKEKQFDVVVRAAQSNTYNLYPIPRNMTYDDPLLELEDSVHLVFEDSTSTYTKAHYRNIVTEAGYTFTEGSAVKQGVPTIMVGIKDGVGAADTYFDEVSYDPSISTDQYEGYVLHVNANQNIIAVLGKDNTGASYGADTLQQMLQQSQGSLKQALIEDAPETMFRGFIEGFYGTPWSHENRKELMRFGGNYKMNTYIYGPKNDPYHAAQWRDPYPQDKLNELAELVEVGKQSNVEFVWAIHVGGKIDLNSQEDIQKVKNKFDQMYGIGVRQFAVFFDDSATDNAKLVSFMNDLQRNYAEAKGDVKPIVFCPQYYNRKNGNEAYLKNLRNFDSDIQIMWTGDFVVSEINQSVIDYIVNLIDRPVYIWWNYPVNDLGRADLLHMGPTEALAPGIRNMSGLAANPMNQAQANKVPLFSIANYTWNSIDYDSEKSWKDSWEHVITDDEQALDAFRIFVQNCAEAPRSFAYVEESLYLKPDLKAFEEKFYSGEDYTAESNTLIERFDEIINAVKTLSAYKGSAAKGIAQEMGQWMDVVKDIAEAGKYALEELKQLPEISKGDDASITKAMALVKEGRKLLAESTNGHGGKKAGQRVLYPFVEGLLDNIEGMIYESLSIAGAPIGYGSAKVDYSFALDGNTDTKATLGSYIEQSYFGLRLTDLTTIHHVEINMVNDAANNKKGFYKKGVLEYSLDNQNWITIGEFDTPDIKVGDLDIKARFIRYRALEMHENLATGENMSDIQLKEFRINAQGNEKMYSNMENTSNIDITRNGAGLTMKSNGNMTLQPNEYVGIKFNTLKNMHSINVQGLQDAVVEYSTNGNTWEKAQLNTLHINQAKYLRLINDSAEAITFALDELSVQLGGMPRLKASVSSTIANDTASGIYSGNAGNLVDGNISSTLWLKRGKVGEERYIELELSEIVALYDMDIFYSGDNAFAGRVDISTDKKKWSTIYTFDKVGVAHQTIKFNKEEAKYIRFYMSQGNWIQIQEMTINSSIAENAQIVIGDGLDAGKTVDGKIFTAYKAGLDAGSLLYKNIDHLNAKNFTLFKNENSSVQIEGKIGETWTFLGNCNQMYNEIELSKFDTISEFRISWKANSNVEIYEMFPSGLLEADKQTLLDTIKVAQQLVKDGALDDINVDVAKRFTKALENAINVKNDENASQNVVDQATAALQLAIKNVKEDTTFMKSILKSAIDKAKAAEDSGQLDKLAPIVKSLIISARNTAQGVYDDEQATMQQCLAAWLHLADALHYLDFKADKSLLEELINTCKDIDTDGYIDGVEEFVAALADAQAVYDNPNALQASIDKAYNDLEKARMELIEKETVQKAVLEGMVKSIEQKVGDGSKYQKNSAYEAFEIALSEAKAILLKEDATQGDVNSAANKLADAYTNIRLKPSEEQLEQLTAFVNIVKNLHRSMFTKEELLNIDEVAKEASNLIANFDEREFEPFTTKMNIVLEMINKGQHNKTDDTAAPKPEDITKGSAIPNTGDATNATNILFMSTLAGVLYELLRKKRKQHA